MFAGLFIKFQIPVLSEILSLVLSVSEICLAIRFVVVSKHVDRPGK